jgi:hypothetical protein
MIMTIRTFLASCIVSALTAISGATACAEPPTFRISQIYSNLDGSIQFVELTEMAGLNGQHHFAGLTLTTTRNGIKKQYVFPHDLPTDQTAHLSIVVAAFDGHVMPLTDTSYLGYNCCYEPAFRLLPMRFLPTGGGTLDFAGIDQVTYAALPTDGENALYRNGTVHWATLPANGRCYMGAGCGSRYGVAYVDIDISAIEYYNATLDHYFVTALADEIDAIDAGRLSGWQRTGERFVVSGGLNTWPDLNRAVCRFYIPPGAGDSHVLSASADECAEIHARFDGFLLETTAAFYAALPDPGTGVCPKITYLGLGFPVFPTTPVYRLWNQRIDSNHRYTWRTAVRDEMISRGYLSEGYGPMGVAMCVR